MTRARNSANLASHGNLFVDITNDRTGIGSVVPGQSLHVAGTAGFHADVTFTGDLYNATWDRSTNKLKFDDNAKISVGDSDNIQIYRQSSGSLSYIQNASGQLIVKSPIFTVQTSNANQIIVRDNAEVELYHNGSQKFETTAYGTDTTGTAVNDGLVVAGVATVTTMNVTGVLTYDDVTSVDSIGIITARSNIDCNGDLDVDGHTDLDNVSIAGVTTFAQKINLSDNFIRNCRGFNTGNEQGRIVVKAGDNSAGGGLRIVEYYNDDTTLFSSEIANFYTNGIELKEQTTITGHLLPATDSTYDLGTNSVRWRNLYADTLYGDGSNLTSLPAQITFSNPSNNRILTSEGGIGVNAESTLTYNGSGTLEISDSGSSYTLRGAGVVKHGIDASSSDNDLVIQNNKTAQNVNSNIIFKGSGASGGTVSEKMRIDTVGNVQIGGNYGSSNLGKLCVDGTLGVDDGGSGTSVLNIMTAANSRFKLMATGSLAQILTQNDVYFAIKTDAGTGSGTERLRIKNDGSTFLQTSNVNINRGTSGAGYPLTVRGPSTGDVIRLERANSGQWHFGFDGSTNFKVKSNTTEVLHISTSGAIRSQIASANASLTLSRNASIGNDDQPIGVLDFASNTGHTVQSRVMGKNVGTNNVGGALVIETRVEGGSLNEVARFRDTGQLQLLNGSFSDNVDCIMGNGGNLTIGGQSKIIFRTATNNVANISSSGNLAIGDMNGADAQTGRLHLRSDSNGQNFIQYLQNRYQGGGSSTLIAMSIGSVDFSSNKYAYMGATISNTNENGTQLVFANNRHNAAAAERVRISSLGELTLKTHGETEASTGGETTALTMDRYGGVKLGGDARDSRGASPSMRGKPKGMRAPNVLDWGLDRGVSTYRAGQNITSFDGTYNVDYGINGSTGTNKWVIGEGPHGGQEWLWSGKSADSNNPHGQGGWDVTGLRTDPAYTYMFVTYVKRVSSNSTGNFYVGTGGVSELGSGTTSGISNPYWTCGGTGNLSRNVWHVCIHYVRSYYSTINQKLPNAGIYRMSDGSRIQDGSNCNMNNGCKHPSATDGQNNITYRSYLYYATANDGTELHWAQPFCYKVDGTEPTVMELVGRELPNSDGTGHWDGT